jgi:dihydropyrimidinase
MRHVYTFVAVTLALTGLTRVVTPARQEPELIVRGGDIVTVDGRHRADVRVIGEIIAEVGPGLAPRDADTEVVDAGGRLVLPGGIDPHVHLSAFWADDYTSGSQAALAGGITTIGNMLPLSTEGVIAGHGAAVAEIERQAIADVMLHPIIDDPTSAIDALTPLVAAGTSSLKLFMTRPDFDRAYPSFRQLVDRAGETGVLSMIHAEDAQVIDIVSRQLVDSDRGALRYYAESRPRGAELVATERAITLARETGSPIYFVHLSSEPALDATRRARAEGLPIYVETRPIYLHLTDERYLGPDGPLFVAQPPLRTLIDVAAMWTGLVDGSIDVIGTDHAPWTREQKMDPALSVTGGRAGMSNLQVMLPMLYSEGVDRDRLTIERFVAVTSTNAAKLFGLYPRKGTVAVGSDADLVVWDPRARRTVVEEDMFSRSGFSIYEDWDVTGWPVVTIRRGEVVYRDGEIVAAAGSGVFLEREPFRAPAL